MRDDDVFKVDFADHKRLVAERFRRIWQLVEDIASHPGKSRKELATQFSLSERQVQADLNVVRREMGLPLVRRADRPIALSDVRPSRETEASRPSARRPHVGGRRRTRGELHDRSPEVPPPVAHLHVAERDRRRHPVRVADRAVRLARTPRPARCR